MLGSEKWNVYMYIHLLQCGKGVNLISDKLSTVNVEAKWYHSQKKGTFRYLQER